MKRPRLLDLFCGAGGAAVGYARAGFEVVGVDVAPQPNFPFEFHQADAMTFPLKGFDAVHASPPCQDHSVSRHTHAAHGTAWMLYEIVRRLERSGTPWVTENVEGPAFGHTLVLCGAHFGLSAVDEDGRLLHLRRHRWFASSHLILAPSRPCGCHRLRGQIGGVYGGGTSDRTRAKNVRRGGYTPKVAVRRALMGIDWMSGAELSQAVPPAYTEWIGRQLVDFLAPSADRGRADRGPPVTTSTPEPPQRLYVARWGLQTAMVWATDREWAMQRVRRFAFARGLRPAQVKAYPIKLNGPVRCRLANANDVEDWLRAGGAPGAVKGWPGLERMTERLAGQLP